MSSLHSEFFGSTLETVLDALPDPIIVTDAEGVVVCVNAAAAEELGARKYVGVPLRTQTGRGELTGPDGTPITWDEHPVARSLAKGESVTGAPLGLRRATGTTTNYLVDAVPLRSGARVVGTVVTFHDAARVATHDLSDDVERLKAIVNLVTEGLFLIDREGRLVFSNRAAEELLGLPTGTALPERLRRLDVRDEHGAPHGPQWFPSSRALTGETVTGVRLRIVDPSGQTRDLVTAAHPLRRRDGTIDGALIAFREITDEIRAREDLEMARESAEEANHLKDEFIAAISHELRTPLQPILAWTEVLRRRGDLDEITTQAVEAIRRNVRLQARLVDDLLDLSRIVHGKLALRFETFDLREQVHAAAEPFEETAALKGVRLTLTLPAEPVLMWGDGARVQQIAGNLISNAVKFTPAGGQIGVHLVAGETTALIEVEDTGEGIAPDEMSVIFEPFGQGASSRRRGGLGIGLNLVKRLAELHGGSADAYSEGRGYGARVRVRLPLRRHRVTPVAEAPPLTRRLDRCEILVIEDNADTRQVMKYMLEAEGARVDTADSGQTGIELARQRRPKVILCDIGLPDIDGLEVARRLRRTSALDDTRLIALTGYGQPEDVQHALDAGFEAHLTKPINLDQLLSLLSETQ